MEVSCRLAGRLSRSFENGDGEAVALRHVRYFTATPLSEPLDYEFPNAKKRLLLSQYSRYGPVLEEMYGEISTKRRKASKKRWPGDFQPDADVDSDLDDDTLFVSWMRLLLCSSVFSPAIWSR